MATVLPSRLLGYVNGEFFVFEPRPGEVEYFNIISYTWGDPVESHISRILGVT